MFSDQSIAKLKKVAETLLEEPEKVGEDSLKKEPTSEDPAVEGLNLEEPRD